MKQIFLHIFTVSLLVLLLLLSSCSQKNESQPEPQPEPEDEKLLERIATLETQVQEMNATIAVLEKADVTLSKYLDSLNSKSAAAGIEALHSYKETLIAYAGECGHRDYDWTTQTFMTLEKYDSLCYVVAHLKTALHDKLLPACVKYAQEQVKDIEAQLHNWVNDTLKGYWTIAETQAEIDKQYSETKNADFQVLRDSLAKMKTDLTAEYEEYIEEAIVNYAGKLTPQISAKIRTTRDNLTKRIDELTERLIKLEAEMAVISNQIPSLESQQLSILTTLDELTGVGASLDSYAKGLNTTLNTMRQSVNIDKENLSAVEKTMTRVTALIDSVKRAQSGLDKYVNNQLKGIHSWADGTLATLAVFDSLTGVVSAVQIDIIENANDIASLHDPILESCRKAVNDSVSKVMAGMKSWVSDKLTAEYWTIAQTRQEFQNVKNALYTNLRKSLEQEAGNITEAYKAELDMKAAELTAQLTSSIDARIATAKSSLTSYCSNAITAAIANNEGNIAEMLGRVDQAKNDLNRQLNSIFPEITSLEAQVKSLEKRLKEAEKRISGLLTQIHSITPVPNFENGGLKLSPDESYSELEFTVMPDSLAGRLASLWESGDVTFNVEYVKTAFRKLSANNNAAPTIPVTKVSSTAQGKLTVRVNHAILDDGFWLKEYALNACLTVNGDGNEKSSEYFPLSFDSEFKLSYPNHVVNLGSSMTITAVTLPIYVYGKIEWSSSDNSVATVSEDGVITPISEGITLITAKRGGLEETIDLYVVEEDVLPGIFRVGTDKFVTFSKGNVQYLASEDKWRFAEHQYDLLGHNGGNETPQNQRSTQSAWIDLFGWAATSFNVNGAKAWNSDTTNTIYKKDVVVNTLEKLSVRSRSDFGYCFDNGNSNWEMLSSGDWEYLFDKRSTYNMHGVATVVNVKGLVILPDEFIDPEVNRSTKSTIGKKFNTTEYNFDSNVYPAEDWEKMEEAGALFLPAAGIRDGISVSLTQTSGTTTDEGYYMTATCSAHSTNEFRTFNFRQGLTRIWEIERSIGCSVRLVKVY